VTDLNDHLLECPCGHLVGDHDIAGCELLECLCTKSPPIAAQAAKDKQ
jgi:hypothetical protein